MRDQGYKGPGAHDWGFVAYCSIEADIFQIFLTPAVLLFHMENKGRI